MTDRKQKIVVISQPRFLPALNYLERMVLADQFIYLDNVQYTPRDWENRNRILNQDSYKWLTAPVKKVPRGTPIYEIEIKQNHNWVDQHLSQLYHSYIRAPFFNAFFPLIEEVYKKKHTRLLDLNLDFINMIKDIWHIHTPHCLASELEITGGGQMLLEQICHTVQATDYISGPYGRDYIDINTWQQSQLGLHFHKFNVREYPQATQSFTPFLSAIDAIFWTGEKGSKLINANRTETLVAE